MGLICQFTRRCLLREFMAVLLAVGTPLATVIEAASPSKGGLSQKQHVAEASMCLTGVFVGAGFPNAWEVCGHNKRPQQSRRVAAYGHKTFAKTKDFVLLMSSYRGSAEIYAPPHLELFLPLCPNVSVATICDSCCTLFDEHSFVGSKSPKQKAEIMRITENIRRQTQLTQETLAVKVPALAQV
jgi:hypothetical protein